MLALFCLRLATGMLACLLFLPPRLINQRFYRTHFLTALGLACLAWLFLSSLPAPLRWPLALTWILAGSLVLCFAGSFVWSLENAPGGRTIIVLATLTLAGALAIVETGEVARAFRSTLTNLEENDSYIEPKNNHQQEDDDGNRPSFILHVKRSPLRDILAGALLGAFTSALVLGAAMTAMLMGHSYLVAPSMSLVPLLRLIVVFAVAVGLRMAVEGLRLWWWTRQHHWYNLSNDALLWLPVRWGVGLLLPLGLAWMAWQTTRIRSTQSATGILYVVVIFVFLGELTSLLLREKGVTL